SERYSTARDLADDLRHFLQSEPAVGSLATLSARITPVPASAHEAVSSVPHTPSAPPTPSGLPRPDSDTRQFKVVPKGLRSFDRNDAGFFLELLPGARDRDGLPESIRFWKSLVESIDPDATFQVGLIYGPSGCGKSSIVKAGLLPRLAAHIVTVYV